MPAWGAERHAGLPSPWGSVAAGGWLPDADAHTCVHTNDNVQLSGGFAVAQMESCIFHGLSATRFSHGAPRLGELALARAAGLLF